MASWKDNLRPASFRGIKFFVDSSQYTGGRRVSFHEFPDRDKPYAEDLGKTGETFKIDGYILGDDYFTQKANIKDAANKEGAGELIHPYYGTLQVQVGAFSIDENTKEGRYAKISFQFYEAGSNQFPQQVDDKQVALENSAAAATAAAKGRFDKKFSILNQPGFVVDGARSALSTAMDKFQAATKDVKAATDAAANLAFSIRNAKAQLSDLMKAPGKLSQHLLDSLALLQGALSKPIDGFNSSKSLFDVGVGLSPLVGTPSSMQEASNANTINDFVKQAAVANAAVAASLVVFGSTEDAVAARETISQAIEEISLSTDDDDVYQTFNDLNAQIVNTVPDVDAQLPNVENVTLTQTTNSLVEVYDLFENPDSEDDLIARNKIKNPGFIMAGTTLEVIDVRKSS